MPSTMPPVVLRVSRPLSPKACCLVRFMMCENPVNQNCTSAAVVVAQEELQPSPTTGGPYHSSPPSLVLIPPLRRMPSLRFVDVGLWGERRGRRGTRHDA